MDAKEEEMLVKLEDKIMDIVDMFIGMGLSYDAAECALESRLMSLKESPLNPRNK